MRTLSVTVPGGRFERLRSTLVRGLGNLVLVRRNSLLGLGYLLVERLLLRRVQRQEFRDPLEVRPQDFEVSGGDGQRRGPLRWPA